MESDIRTLITHVLLQLINAGMAFSTSTALVTPNLTAMVFSGVAMLRPEMAGSVSAPSEGRLTSCPAAQIERHLVVESALAWISFGDAAAVCLATIGSSLVQRSLIDGV